MMRFVIPDLILLARHGLRVKPAMTAGFVIPDLIRDPSLLAWQRIAGQARNDREVTLCRLRMDLPTCSSASSVNRRAAIGSSSICSRSMWL